MALGESADEFFRPHEKTGFLVLDGREGWPAATLYRYHVLLENERHLSDFDYVFLVDADMRFDAPVRDEILSQRVATLHPGYVGKRGLDLPYERNVASISYVPLTWDVAPYYAGGFVGGDRESFLALARRMREQIDWDYRNGTVARWHDESHLNRILIDSPPTLALSPSYCYPDDDRWYRDHAWVGTTYERRLVALDKTKAERGNR